MQILSTRIAQILCALFFVFLPLFSISQDINPYEKNLHRFDEMMYVLTSKWVDNEEKAWKEYLQALKKEGFEFKENPSHSLQYFHDSVSLEKGIQLKSYITSSGKEWAYVLSADNTEEMVTQYKAYQGVWTRNREKGIRGIGENASRGANRKFGQYIMYHTGETLSSIFAFVLRDNKMMVVGMQLDFPVQEKYDELSHEKRIKVRDKYERFQILLDKFSDSFIHPDSWLKKPLRGKQLTAEQRLYGFTQFWTEVKYNFAFFDQVPDLDWDKVLYEYLPIIQQDQSNEEYFRTLKLICAKLGDGHTNIYPPREELDWPGIQLKNFGGKAYVVNVKKDFAEEIPLGTEVLSVAGISTDTYLKEKIFPYISSSTDHIRYNWGIRDMLDGKKGTEVMLALKLPDGKLREKKMIRNKELGGDWVKGRDQWQLFNLTITEDNFAHVKLNSFGRENIIEEFEKRLDSIKACKGVIIDLRGNGGGSSTIGYAILNHFTKKPYKGSLSRTRDHRAAHKAWGKFVDADTPLEDLSEFDQRSRLTFKGEYWHEFELSEYQSDVEEIIDLPVVVLIGNNTASAAEDFLVALDQVGIAKLIGSPTFGSTGQPLMMDLPGGGSARICTKRDTYPDGREFVGYGIQPDYKVEQSVEDYLTEKDVVLTYAVDFLKKNPGFAKDKK
ncbi:MAG: S41 family peptidase [Bacteroidia bacterium]|nr:S41 family peptidase [Bacteroidia bacterium]